MSDHSNEDKVPRIDSLPRETQPARALEDRVIHELRRQGLLSQEPRQPARRWVPQWIAAACAAIIFFGAGWFARESRIPATSQTSTVTAPRKDPRFLLLLRPGSMKESSPAVEAERVREYTDWGSDLFAKGHFVSAAKLEDAAELLTATSSSSVTLNAETSPGANGAVQGFFLIAAPSLEAALEIARSCPHLRHGGAIELRPLAAT